MQDSEPKPNPAASQEEGTLASRPSLRVWPAFGLLILASGAILTLSRMPHRSQQELNLQIAKVVLATLLCLLVWMVFFSRMPWKRIAKILGLLAGIVGVFAAAFRIHGVTGNLIPILEPRWAKPSFRLPDTAPPPLPSDPLASANSFPQFLGPLRNGILTEPKLDPDWKTHPPKELWRQPVGPGWSGFVIVGRLAITQEQREERECVCAYDLHTGTPRWVHEDTARYFNTIAGEGPRATPTISEKKVITQGATGILNCLDLDTGRLLWSHAIFSENKSSVPAWGQSSSPLVYQGQVIVNPGGQPERGLVAYSIQDGSLLWASGKDSATYSSPVVVTVSGEPQLLVFSDSLVGHDPMSGKSLWSYRWPGGHPHIAQPIPVSESDFILSSGYGTGSGRISVHKASDGSWTAKEVWRSNRMRAKFTNLILHEDHLYGLDDGILACLEVNSGTLKWKDGRYGHGQVLKVGQYLLVMAESGEVNLIQPQPDHLIELSRLSALNGKTWNPPALAGAHLLVRNDKEAACFELPLQSSLR